MLNLPGVTVESAGRQAGDLRRAERLQVFLSDCALDDDARWATSAAASRLRCGRWTAGASGSAAQAPGHRARGLRGRDAYALERKTFGQPIAQHQAIQFKLADMKTEIEAARMLLWRAAVKKDSGGALFDGRGDNAKLFASEVANRAAKEGVQIFGGYGYLGTTPPNATSATPRSPAPRFTRGPQIQRIVIASALLKE